MPDPSVPPTLSIVVLPEGTNLPQQQEQARRGRRVGAAKEAFGDCPGVTAPSNACCGPPYYSSCGAQ